MYMSMASSLVTFISRPRAVCHHVVKSNHPPPVTTAICRAEVERVICGVVARAGAHFHMKFIFEYVSIGSDGSREALERGLQEAGSLAKAEARAKATLRHVRFGNRRPDLCVLRDRSGAPVKVVLAAG